ncbi:Uncharacterised protein [Bordetella ansorpii]|uniref:Iron-containing redox enzyme family protein n=1 Tax=Bordetella ansorpii TaxID=288768 RepID=A0A157QNS6_9BORD|nr:hypothetical protein [Bordetella ansorpii]SAI47278.1 Uncharacterised protein [Bordetella ansorpii]
MVALSALDLNMPRQQALAAMRASVSPDLWEENAQFVAALREQVRTHPISNHRALELLTSGAFSKDQMIRIHLEYRHAIVQIFTDALLAAQLEARQLEPRLAPAAKIAPRFLLALNVFDEFGFRPGLDGEGYYRGSPLAAHYPLFEQVLDNYGVTAKQRASYEPSVLAREVRRCLADSYATYIDVVALLAVGEQEVIWFSPALRDATALLGIDVSDGYYRVHGVSTDQNSEAADDDHEDDLWHVLTQALVPEDYDRVRRLCVTYSDLWDAFWMHQIVSAT